MFNLNDRLLKPLSSNTTTWGDRFVPKRSFLDKDLIHYKLSSNHEEFNQGKDILCQEVNSSGISTYQQNLKKVFLPNAERYTRILPLYVHNQPKNKPTERVKHWPVRARRNPCIFTPEIVLDLPSFGNDLNLNLLDWGSSNFIAAGISTYLYLWHASTNVRLQVNLTNQLLGLTSVKWHPTGSVIACASYNGLLEMIDINTQKVIAAAKNMCHVNCFVTAIDFHPLQHSLAIGCSQGNVAKYNPDLSCKSSCQLHRGAVLLLSFSCDGTYLASTGYDKHIYIARANAITFSIKMDGQCRGLAWHPWRPSYLVLGDSTGIMQLHNIASGKTLATYYPEIDHLNAILSLSFSKKTGELVSSHRINTEINCTQVNVLESFNRVVDRMCCHLGTIFHLKWNPDGTKLATTGSDEVVHVWNFLPQSKNQERSKDKSSKQLKNKLGTIQNSEMELQHSITLGLLIR